MFAYKTIALLALFAATLTACDTGSSVDCPNVPTAAAPGTFALRVERPGACFVVRGERAAHGKIRSVYTDTDLFLANLTVDADGDEGALDLLFEVLSIGDLPDGSHTLANLYERSSIPHAPPSGDVRFIEYPGMVSFAAILEREYLWTRSGHVLVGRPGGDVVEGRIKADMETAAGETVHVEGVFALLPGPVDYTFIQ